MGPLVLLMRQSYIKTGDRQWIITTLNRPVKHDHAWKVVLISKRHHPFSDWLVK
jgi:hypothetical protein